MFSLMRKSGVATVGLRQAVSGLVAAGFVVALAFFVGSLWSTADAAPAHPGVDDNSLLLSLDKPQAPAPKVTLNKETLKREVQDFDPDQQADLATELNNWNYTAGNPFGLAIIVFEIETNPAVAQFFGELYLAEILFPQFRGIVQAYIDATEVLLAAFFGFPVTPVSPSS